MNRLGDSGQRLSQRWSGCLATPDRFEVKDAALFGDLMGDLGDRVGNDIGTVSSLIPRL